MNVLKYRLLQHILKHISTVQELKKDSSDECTGRSRAGLTGKIHALLNEKGKILRFTVTKGNVNDCTQAINLLNSVIRKGIYILGDKAYDTDNIIDYIIERSAYAVIPSRGNRKIQREYNKEIYIDRNVIERFFNKLKNFRRGSARYDKLVLSFMSFVQLAAIFILIPKFPNIA